MVIYVAAKIGILQGMVGGEIVDERHRLVIIK
jgi:hypothetical protein